MSRRRRFGLWTWQGLACCAAGGVAGWALARHGNPVAWNAVTALGVAVLVGIGVTYLVDAGRWVCGRARGRREKSL